MPLETLAVAMLAAHVPPPSPVPPLPTAQQLAWHDKPICALVRFGINTFTAKDLGDGSEVPERFHPSEFDARQWTRSLKSAGVGALVLTAADHDGFCLWPTAVGAHSVRGSPWMDGHGDVVRDVAAACAADGLPFGIALSTWDRHRARSVASADAGARFRQQIHELATGYGHLLGFWIAGAPEGDVAHDWGSFVDVMRADQPAALIASEAGPDIRRLGNEDGEGGEPNWSPFDVAGFRPGIPHRERELANGHRGGGRWVPAEATVSLRPGRFWRQSENDRVKSLRELESIWYATVGRGCNLLLSIPADRRGLLPEHDIERLIELRRLLDSTFDLDLAAGAAIGASSIRGNDPSYAPGNLVDADPSNYWATDDSVRSGWIEFAFPRPSPVNRIDLREAIALGQRVERFTIAAKTEDGWRTIATGTTIGARRILRFPTVVASGIRVSIDEARACPTLRSVGIFCAPPEVSIDANEDAFEIATTVRMTSDMADAAIHYTTDGSEPSTASPRYSQPLTVRESTTLRAIAVRESRVSLFPASAHLTRFDAGTFRNSIQLFIAPKPGLRLRRYDGAMASLDQLKDTQLVDEGVATELALPKTRPADDFAFVFDGYLDVPKDGVYTFSLFSDDGSRLWIGDTPVVDRDGGAVWEQREGRIALRAGWHVLRVEYFEMKGEERFRVRWSGPGFRDQPLPPGAFGH